MQLPKLVLDHRPYVRFSRYLMRRLRRAGLDSLIGGVQRSMQKVIDGSRAMEDADGPVQDARADRDGADDDLDAVAQDARAKLGGRSATANKTSPYIDIFPQGIDYYTKATIGDETKRYGELKTRLEAHLLAKDEVRVAAVKGIEAGLLDWNKAVKALETAESAEAVAQTAFERAVGAWSKEIEQVYGELIKKVGSAAAEKFFPRVTAPRKSAAPADAAAAGPKEG